MTQTVDRLLESNGHQPDEDQLARNWIASLRQGNQQPLPQSQRWRGALINLDTAFREGGLTAVESVNTSMVQTPRQWPGFAELLNPPKQPLQGVVEAENEEVLIPALPESARLPEGASKGACPWLDEYIEYSKLVSSEGYEDFHEACGLWVLSTIAGRRVKIPLRRRQYTPLMILLVADTTLYAKSETVEVAISVLQAAGLRWMLGSDETTPQKLHSDMVGTIPKEYFTLPEGKQHRVKNRLAMSGQRGWFYDEFGQLIRSMLKQNGYMAELRGLLLKLDKCADEYSYATQTRGTETIDKPYLSLIGCMTPPDIKKDAKAGGAFWTDGLWARFVFVCPPPDTYIDAPFEVGEIPVPTSLASDLDALHQRLGMPFVDIRAKTEKGKETDIPDVTRDPLRETECQFGEGVWDAWARYRTALKHMIVAMKRRDMAGSYSRLAIRAIRVAALLAILENNGIIEMRHWARAQEIAERWRLSLHELYAQINAVSQEASTERSIEDEILRHMKRLESEKGLSPSAADLRNYMKQHAVSRIQEECEAMTRAGLLTVNRTSHTRRYALVKAQEMDEEEMLMQTQEQKKQRTKDSSSYVL